MRVCGIVLFESNVSVSPAFLKEKKRHERIKILPTSRAVDLLEKNKKI